MVRHSPEERERIVGMVRERLHDERFPMSQRDKNQKKKIGGGDPRLNQIFFPALGPGVVSKAQETLIFRSPLAGYLSDLARAMSLAPS